MYVYIYIFFFLNYTYIRKIYAYILIIQYHNIPFKYKLVYNYIIFIHVFFFFFNVFNLSNISKLLSLLFLSLRDYIQTITFTCYINLKKKSVHKYTR